MRKRPDGSWQYSPKDLTAWLEGDFAAWCEREAAERRGAGAGRSVPPSDSARQPDSTDDELELAARYGIAHEQAHLERLWGQHPELVSIDSESKSRFEETVAAMRRGAPIIYQGVLEHESWMGITDFLHRTDASSALGAWQYQPWDTKLARSAKPYYLLQLCTYADLLGSIQGVRPEQLGFVLGDGTSKHFRTDEFWHYYQRLRRRFVAFQEQWNADSGPPDPGADRSHGRWSDAAASWLAERDDLSLVAGMSRSQIVRLREAGIDTLAALGRHTDQGPKSIATATFARLREQAAMQLRTRAEATIAWQLREPDPAEPRRGFALLPPPSSLDVFYDIEGFPYAPNGLEYLQGAVTVEPGGALAFHDWWAHDDASEKRAFEEFIDWVWDRWTRDPSMHIYHYAAYEQTALKRLSTRYATREHEVDQFLRHGVLVDLLTVTRQGLTIGTPSYSLKDIEHLYMPPREGDVVSAGASVVEYQRWIDSGEPGEWQQSPILAAIRDYNRVDCESTAHLRDWLLARQREAGIEWHRGGAEEQPVTTREKDPEQVLAEALTQKATKLEGEAQRLTQLLAWLLEFHRRDDKPMWWRYFERLSKDEVELYDDPDCLAGLIRTETEPWADKKSLVYEYSFDPDQETRLHEGSKVHVVASELIGSEIHTMEPIAGRLTMRIGSKRALPDRCHLLPNEHVPAKPIPAAIEHYVREWSEGRVISAAVDDLLHRRLPRLHGRNGGTVVSDGGDLVAETITAVRAMDHTTLAIQGPPGTGKTTTAAKVIAALLDDGKRIGIVATGHAVVCNLLAKIVSVAPRHKSLLYKVGGDEAPLGVEHIDPKEATELVGSDPIVLGGTSWLFARPEMRGTLDYLFVDEAGQLSLANVVGSGLAADNLVLIGDQMQLAQVTQGEHPGESGYSCLQYLLQDHQTIPAELGVLLNQSYRMHPGICDFISDAYYEGRLSAAERTRGNRIEWSGAPAGVTFVPVTHEGRAQTSEEEVAVIRALVGDLVGKPATIEDAPRTLTLDDILIVAPFNAQVRALKLAIPGGRIGTVDKFQGQEAPAVIVSMTASTLDDAPRGAGFLLSPNRLNVAISRAQALAIVVGSPALGDVRVRSVEEMRLVNGWCRVEAHGPGVALSP
ncbi:MAG: TM0106 family RecB-like putative nuclease [Gemmatimonadales bacterium]